MTLKRKLVITLAAFLGALVAMSVAFLIVSTRTVTLMQSSADHVALLELFNNSAYITAVAPSVQPEIKALLNMLRQTDLRIMNGHKKVAIAIAVLSIGFLGAGFGLIVVVIRSIIQPLNMLQKGAKIIGEGNLNHHIAIDSKDEIGALAQTINQMVRDLKILQIKIIQIDRMISIGHLAGGVAHEINNPLTGVLGQAQLLLEQIPAEHPFRTSVVKIESAAQRCRQITRALLDFASEKDYKFQRADINTLIDGALDFTRIEMELNNIKLIKNTNQLLPAVRVSPMHIQQVFFNIITNAIQSMPHGGKLSITSTPAEKNTVEIYFSDTGNGISGLHLSHVFDPFFTTKDIGHGTGLGLTVSYGIVHRHGGNIVVNSDGEGLGATIIVTLPVGK
ncbi:MAG: ATP-binding protein [Endomicrobiales bacterium]|jgi:two-component system NtrC family sensor kinase